MRPSAVIFDFDGVIVESTGIKTRAFRHLFEEICPEVAEAAVAYHLGNEGISRFDKFRYVFGELCGRPVDDAEVARLGERFSELVLEEILEAPFVPGAVEFLEAFHGELPLFIASGTPQGELEHIVEARGLTGYFEEVHGTPATKPAIINGILERHGWESAEVVVVGDADSDQRAATATGVAFVAREIPGAGKVFDCEHRVCDLTRLAEILGLTAVEGDAS